MALSKLYSISLLHTVTVFALSHLTCLCQVELSFSPTVLSKTPAGAHILSHQRFLHQMGQNQAHNPDRRKGQLPSP
jgi:hypothetical protein